MKEMSLYAETPLIKIYWLDDLKAGYGVWSGLPLIEPTKEALGLARKLLVSRFGQRWISSTEDALVSPGDTQLYIGDWLREMAQIRALRAWADIPPKSPVSRLVVKNLGAVSSHNGVLFAQFETLDEARKWIATK